MGEIDSRDALADLENVLNYFLTMNDNDYNHVHLALKMPWLQGE